MISLLERALQRLLDYNLLASLHIIAVALWLGIDLATLVTLRRMRRPELAPETRREMLDLCRRLDLGPRTAMVLLVAFGITLTYRGRWGMSAAGDLVMLGGTALLGAVWLIVVWYQHWASRQLAGTDIRTSVQIRRGRLAAIADLWFRLVLTGSLLVAAVWSLVSAGGPIGANWLSVKLIVFAGVVVLGLGLRVSLGVAADHLSGIVDQGSTTERETTLARSLRTVQILMIGTWIGIVLIIWLSVAKPS